MIRWPPSLVLLTIGPVGSGNGHRFFPPPMGFAVVPARCSGNSTWTSSVLLHHPVWRNWDDSLPPRLVPPSPGRWQPQDRYRPPMGGSLSLLVHATQLTASGGSRITSVRSHGDDSGGFSWVSLTMIGNGTTRCPPPTDRCVDEWVAEVTRLPSSVALPSPCLRHGHDSLPPQWFLQYQDCGTGRHALLGG